MKLLLTAFEAFDGDTVNPAQEAVKRLDPAHTPGVEIHKLTVPTVFHQSLEVLREALSQESYDAVLCVGQAGGRPALSVERVAINVDDARIPDNAGQTPIDTAIFADGAPAYFATLPIKAMVEAVQAEGIPAAVSNSAGTFVCNHLMYGVLYFLARHYPQARGGFIHVPFIPEQVLKHPQQPSMSLTDITRGLEAAIRAMATHEQDIRISGGTNH